MVEYDTIHRDSGEDKCCLCWRYKLHTSWSVWVDSAWFLYSDSWKFSSWIRGFSRRGKWEEMWAKPGNRTVWPQMKLSIWGLGCGWRTNFRANRYSLQNNPWCKLSDTCMFECAHINSLEYNKKSQEICKLCSVICHRKSIFMSIIYNIIMAQGCVYWQQR